MTAADPAFTLSVRVVGDIGIIEWEGRASPQVLADAISLAADDSLIAQGLRRVEASVPATDTMARRALQRSGFRLEGVRRQAHAHPSGDWVDVAWYARLASDIVYGPGGFTAVMNSVLPRKRCIAHVLITDQWGRVCLVETTFKDDWELPGGIVDAGESPMAAAVREIGEELSVELQPGRILVVDWLGPHLGWEDAVEIIFDGGTVNQETIDAMVPDLSEIRAIHWLAPDKAAEKMAPFAKGRLLAAVGCAINGGTLYLERGRPTR